MLSIGLALIPTGMVSFILREREENSKHMQLISGMSLFGYWLANMISDILKAYVPTLLILAITYMFDLNYEGVWALLLLFPLAIVPFSYVNTILFRSDSVAQIVTLFLHFLIGGLGALVVYALQIIPNTAHIGNELRWWFTIVPSFCVTYGVVYSSTASAGLI